MRVRGPLRCAGIVGVALVVSMIAFAATRYAFEFARPGGVRRDPAADGDDAAGSAAARRRSETRRLGSRPRERAYLEADAAGLAEAGAAPGGVSADAVKDGAAPVEPIPPQAPADVIAAEPTVQLAEFALPAAPDRDAATGEAAPVAPGAAPELELATFLATAAGAVRPVAQLVGERKPPVDEGVPVSLAGRVIDAERGAPVEGAQLVVTSTFYVRRYLYDHHLREVARVATDADGRYAIERLNVDPAHFGQGGSLYVTVIADGRRSAQMPLAGRTDGEIVPVLLSQDDAK